MNPRVSTPIFHPRRRLASCARPPRRPLHASARSSGPEGGFQDYVRGTGVSTPKSCTADRCQGALVAGTPQRVLHPSTNRTSIRGPSRQGQAQGLGYRVSGIGYRVSGIGYDAWTRAMCFLPA